jgi:hypothetical protein
MVGLIIIFQRPICKYWGKTLWKIGIILTALCLHAHENMLKVSNNKTVSYHYARAAEKWKLNNLFNFDWKIEVQAFFFSLLFLKLLYVNVSELVWVASKWRSIKIFFSAKRKNYMFMILIVYSIRDCLYSSILSNSFLREREIVNYN